MEHLKSVLYAVLYNSIAAAAATLTVGIALVYTEEQVCREGEGETEEGRNINSCNRKTTVSLATSALQ